ncbi:hypothetical protein EDC01DRAFT_723498 [Geopyxis carbonaria]|nr:hypothetical protein EDC01DRAFT_723498 [Geopyxis carbonaria]
MFSIFLFFYDLLQRLIIYLFSPAPPQPNEALKGPRVAIIGAGLTGVSAAAHCVSHGSDVTLFDEASNVGGIWSRVNHTSGLQIHSIMYRFHPSVEYSREYPKREQILEQIRGVWKTYNLESKTRFNTRVTSVTKHSSGKWIINNDESLGLFSGIIAAVGTCGAPKCPSLPGLPDFAGKTVHSSQLEGVDMRGKSVSVVGGGASAIEALEYAAAHGASKINLLSRSDKWIIPRNPVIDALLSLNIFGFQLPGLLSVIPEFLLRKLFYRDLESLAPPRNGTGNGLFESTPMVNSSLLSHIRSGRAQWLRGDLTSVTKDTISYTVRAQGVPKGGPGHHISIRTDILVFATGFHRPALSFLPPPCFADPRYTPPNWYLQSFPPAPAPPGAIAAINCTYVNAIGTVGHFHIGVYTRLLLMFLTDPLTRPPAAAMRFWVRLTQWLKTAAPTGALDFFTYAELCWWFCECVLVNPFRWKWIPFVVAGWTRPVRIVQAEKGWVEREGVKEGPW